MPVKKRSLALEPGSTPATAMDEQARIVRYFREDMPEITYVDFEGNLRELNDDLKNGPTLVNLWASWCGPCITELVEFKENTPLAQGLLTGKYLKGIPEGSRASQGKSLAPDAVSENVIKSLRALADIAERRGQTLAQMALAWVLRDGGITTALIGASRPEQVLDCVGAIDRLDFSQAELDEIDASISEETVNLWARSAEIE